jgi:hypothetical protein
LKGAFPALGGSKRQCYLDWILSLRPVTTFYKGESQEKDSPGDWKERVGLPWFPANVVLRGSWGFVFDPIHFFMVTTLLGF